MESRAACKAGLEASSTDARAVGAHPGAIQGEEPGLPATLICVSPSSCMQSPGGRTRRPNREIERVR